MTLTLTLLATINAGSIQMKSDQRLSKEEAKRMSVELAVLSRQQYEALQIASYIHMSESERTAYDTRRLRIGRICEELAKFASQGTT